MELGGEKQFPNLSNFALALCTVPNSSSEVERSFSDMEAIFSNSKAANIGQELLEAKMTVKGSMKNQSLNCKRCVASKSERERKILAGEKVAEVEKCKHCHCTFFKVDDELLAELRDHQPAKRFKERELQVSAENAANIANVRKKEEELKDRNAKILEREVREMKKRFLDARVKAVKQSGVAAAVKVTVPKKRVPIEKEESDNRKKKKLAFLKPESIV